LRSGGRVDVSKPPDASSMFNTLTKYASDVCYFRKLVLIPEFTQSSAQRALALHNTEIVPDSGQRLQVWISDPLRKQTRTDANAAKRELYVTGLTKQATEADLRKLFEPVRTSGWCCIIRFSLTFFSAVWNHPRLSRSTRRQRRQPWHRFRRFRD
jgi:hypothetical protein